MSNYLYVFTTPEWEDMIWEQDERFKRLGIGKLKIGYTSGRITKRVQECLAQGTPHPEKAKILWSALLPSGTTDKDIHGILRSMRCRQNGKTEWFNCCLDEVKHAYLLLTSGRYMNKREYTLKALERFKIQNEQNYHNKARELQVYQLNSQLGVINDDNSIQGIIEGLSRLYALADKRASVSDFSKTDLELLKILTFITSWDKYKDVKDRLKTKIICYLKRKGVNSGSIGDIKFSLQQGTMYLLNKYSSVIFETLPDLKELSKYNYEYIRLNGDGVNVIERCLQVHYS